MKLRNKIMLAVSIACILFLIVSSFVAIRESLDIFIPVTILFFLAIFSFVDYCVVKRIENINSPNSTRGNDEITAIALQLNELLENTENLKQQLHNNTEELKKAYAERENNHSINQPELKKKKVLEQTVAHKDSLTNLPNRIFFNDTLNKAISYAKRRNQFLAILIIDLDGFKKINETLGHTFGDYVLNKFGSRLTKTLRSEDLLARLNGDEFIVLLNDITKPKFASVVAEKILHACYKPIKEFFLTASIGICIYPNDGSSLEELLNNADKALFKAKQLGGNRYQFHTHEMDVEAREFIKLENALQQSILNNELVLYYQPKLNIKKGSIVGIEALVRWAHPELGILNPTQFISIAEETGFIAQMSEWALREACKTNKYWQDEGYEHLTVSLNLSPRQFRDENIATTIANILQETGLNPQYLELEINEATVMDNIEIATERLMKIKAIGVQISIDHFGAGYTSISHLKRFPINAIKIDQNYIKGVPNNPNDSAITNAFIALAHNLGFDIVAEGVETAEQVQYLTAQNCDMIQGYFLSHPLPAQKIELQFKKLMDRALL